MDRWRRLYELPVGAVISAQRCWELAQAWYGDRLSRDWRPPGPEEAERRPQSVGLADPFWRLL